MPITLPPISRRNFLGTSLAAGFGLLAARNSWGAEVDPHRVFLLSDTHIAADAKLVNQGVNMFDNLKQTVGELLAEQTRAVSVVVNGDLAFKLGEPDDYKQFLEQIKPLREAGMPIRLAMGNHDNRSNFWDAVKSEKDAVKPGDPVEERVVTTFQMERANWFMLDSLDKTNSTPGVLGKKQLEWLGKELDAHTDKPAIVMVHHNPVFPNPNAKPKTEEPKPDAKPADYSKAKAGGITDTEDLWPVLTARKHVKALIWGHTHNWALTKRDEIQMINLPTVAYPFTKGKATGWVDCQVRENGISLKLTCIDKAHANNGEKAELDWLR